MDIGKEQPAIIVEPINEPFRAEAPPREEPAPGQPEQPEEVPAERAAARPR